MLLTWPFKGNFNLTTRLSDLLEVEAGFRAMFEPTLTLGYPHIMAPWPHNFL